MKDIEAYKAKHKIIYICIYTTYMHTQYTIIMTVAAVPNLASAAGWLTISQLL